MNNALSKILIFAAGAAIGSAATWYFVKTKYERIANEEIESVKEAFAPKKFEPREESDSNHDMVTYEKMLGNLNYTNYPEVTNDNDEKGVEEMTILNLNLYVFNDKSFDKGSGNLQCFPQTLNV